MINIFMRLFIKDYNDIYDPQTRSAIGRLAGALGVLCNLLLALTKTALGLLTHSTAILADAANNLTDAVSSLMTSLGFTLAQRPADKEHPFGHARFEYISGLAVAALIMLIAVGLLKSSFEKIINPEEVYVTGISIALLLISICVKLWMFILYRKLGKMINSVTLSAAAADSRNDVIATVSVLTASLAYHFFGLNLDAYMGFGVSIFILYSGFTIAKDAVSPLLGKSAEKEFTDKLTQLILSHEKILGIHELLIHDYGPGQCYASVHAELNSKEDPVDCHAVIDEIEHEAMEKLNVHLVIHYDPIEKTQDFVNITKADT